MDIASTSRRAFRRAAQKLGRRTLHEVRGLLAVFEMMLLINTTPLQLHQDSSVGEDTNGLSSASWLSSPLPRSLESLRAVCKEFGSPSVEDTCPRVPRVAQSPQSSCIDLPPIARLPTELLSLIFFASAYRDDPLDRPFLDRDFVPFKLTQVCARWRDIAVDLPLLWQRFELRPCVGLGNHQALARLCAERARGLGLTVAYHELSLAKCGGTWANDTTGLPVDVEFCDCPLGFIIACIDQIKVLLVSVGERSVFRLATDIGSPVSTLERLGMVFHRHTREPELLVNLYSGPKVVDLLWNTLELGAAPHVLEFPGNAPWHQLVNLEVLGRRLRQNKFLDILEGATSLQSVSATLDGAISSAAQFRRPICHKALRSVTVEGDGPLDLVFSKCSLPALRELALLVISRPDQWDDSPAWPFWQPRSMLLQVVAQAESGLERLCIGSCGTIDESILSECLQLPQMSTMLELSLATTRPSVITERLISLFHPAQRGPVLMPDLRALLLAGCATADGVIADMLLARRARTDRLAFVSVEYESRDRTNPRDSQVIVQFKKDMSFQ
ncbi:hypothetical protein K523DRAFT_228651 [Schizophyllum commune Tattone D]|nr:hypothetical protein K523DRAFT_228651 [Schizophyllum commune Tattone D]